MAPSMLQVKTSRMFITHCNLNNQLFLCLHVPSVPIEIKFQLISIADPFQEEDNDGGPSKSSQEGEVQVSIGPVTRSQAKAFKEKLNKFA